MFAVLLARVPHNHVCSSCASVCGLFYESIVEIYVYPILATISKQCGLC